MQPDERDAALLFDVLIAARELETFKRRKRVRSKVESSYLLRARRRTDTASLLSASFEPFRQRSLALSRTAAGDQAVDADVFVQVGPVNPLAMTDKPPVRPFLGRSVRQ